MERMSNTRFKWDGTWSGADGVPKDQHTGFSVSDRVCINCGMPLGNHVIQIVKSRFGDIHVSNCREKVEE